MDRRTGERAFPSRQPSPSRFMPYHIKGPRNLLKRSRRVVLFKRNRLGRISTPIPEALRDVSAHLGGMPSTARRALCAGSRGASQGLRWLSSLPVRGESGDVRRRAIGSAAARPAFRLPKEEKSCAVFTGGRWACWPRETALSSARPSSATKGSGGGRCRSAQGLPRGRRGVISRAVGQAVLREGGSRCRFYDDRIALARREASALAAGKNEERRSFAAREKRAGSAGRFNKQPT